MKKTLNLIFNQAGFVVVAVVMLLVYYNIVGLTWKFVMIVGLILLVTLISSQAIYKSLYKNSHRIVDK